MHDLVIRNGVIVDGTGAARYEGDLAIDGERIAAVGEVAEAGRREIDADGRIVSPGWVDIHTHYDGQATWDPDLAPSSTHGVTTIVMGNCGVGFAPARPERHDWLISLLEGVEDIPGTALTEGMTWGWESFPEYLDVLDRMAWTLDVGTQVPHAALRTYVMGDDGADNTVRASHEQIEAMSQLCEEAVRAGALGFTTSRTWVHRTSEGAQIGTLKAGSDEVLGLAAALQRAGTGVIQLISDAYQTTDDALVASELELLESIALHVGRPMSFTVQQSDESPGRWRELLDAIARWNEAGAVTRAQTAVRPIGVVAGLTSTVNPFRCSPTYRSIAALPLAERVARMTDPAVRDTILAEHGAFVPSDFSATTHSGYDRMFPMDEYPNYEPRIEDSLAAIGAREGRPGNEVMYDYFVGDGGTRLVYLPFMNYSGGSLDDVAEMIASPLTLSGLSDAGAHCNTLSDGTMPTTAISHWTRDRADGRTFDLEYMVHRQTQATAEWVGFHDRGVLAPGKLADVNVFDHDEINAFAPELVEDLPAGGTRLLQRSNGYAATIKRGVTTVESGALTGERPGSLQRGPQG
ncbi:MAG: amidohydrolase family protein [Actinomycetota bacterium]